MCSSSEDINRRFPNSKRSSWQASREKLVWEGRVTGGIFNGGHLAFLPDPAFDPLSDPAPSAAAVALLHPPPPSSTPAFLPSHRPPSHLPGGPQAQYLPAVSYRPKEASPRTGLCGYAAFKPRQIPELLCLTNINKFNALLEQRTY